MKNYKKFISAALIITLALTVFTSCKSSEPMSGSSSSDDSSIAASSASAVSQVVAWTPVTVKDSSGKNITITKRPMKIVSLPVWSSEILFDTIDIARIAGISAWGDSAATSATADKAKAVKSRVESKNAEGIVSIGPDLVILDTFNDADGALSKTLGEAGITVLLMSSPTDFDEIRDAIVTLTTATGDLPKGADIIAQLNNTLIAIKTKTDTLPASKKLTAMYYEDSYGNAGMLAAYGKNSPFNAIAEAAGLTNVCDLADYSPVNKEKVVGEWKPQVLVVPSNIYDSNGQAVDEKGATIIAAIKNDPLLKNLPAVKNNRIFALSQKYSGSTSQYMAKAVEELAKDAYPDLFK
ncbi:MAG: ABC transporter substrate-binding protein [Saccharofermentanales bacterium]